MTITINGTTGISGVDGSSATPAMQGADTNTGISYGTDTVTINTGGTARVTTDASGNVGIGTVSPATTLQVTGDITQTWAASMDRFVGSKFSTTYELGLHFIESSRETRIVSKAADSTGLISFYTGVTPTERMRIDSSGNLLVGTTAADAKFMLSGSIPNNIARFINTNASAYGPLIQYGSGVDPNGTSNEFIDCRSNLTTLRFAVRSNGGIANFSGNNVNLSDRREKTNFALAKNYLDIICAIPVQTFNYIDQNRDADDGATLGVIAQDVQAVAPELVTESNWGTKDEPKMRLSVYQTDLQYALMKCIQEQQATISAMEIRLAALEA